MLTDLRKLYQYRELLRSMVVRDLKIRYKNSVLGFFWSLINPLLTCAVLTYVFKGIMADSTKNYSAYILAAYLPYMFFSMSIMDAASSVLQNIQLVKKIYFPREILPLASVIANFIHFLLALVIFFLYLATIWIMHPAESPFQATTIYLPILLAINFCLSLGIGFLLSAVNTFYEDVKYIVGFLTWILLFLCPVMYQIEQVYYTAGPRHYLYYNALNPVGILINAYKKVLLAPQAVRLTDGKTYPPIGISWVHISYAGFMSFVILIFGYAVFNRVKWRFVERI